MRAVSQQNADPSKPYMAVGEVPPPSFLDKELEHCTVHFVHHFADGLAVIAHHHPDKGVAVYAAAVHYHLAEELLHFVPETRGTFLLRHRDKKGGTDPLSAQWSAVEQKAKDDWMSGITYRFGEPSTSGDAPPGADLSWFLHRLWGKATGTPDYSKAEWKQFQLLIDRLEARAAHFESDAIARATITEHRSPAVVTDDGTVSAATPLAPAAMQVTVSIKDQSA
jgi:hypothetical protein